MEKDGESLVKYSQYRKHGMSNHPLFSLWDTMMRRCYSENRKEYKDYGGRGIIVCKEWHEPSCFISDMFPSYEKGLSLDRIDVNGSYCKDNCRWSTRIQQQRNTRHNVVFNGEYAVDASIRLGGKTNLIANRRLRGWSLSRAFSTPAFTGKKLYE